MKVRFTLSIGFAGACHEDVLDVQDDLGLDPERPDLDEQLSEEWKDWANNYIDGSYEVLT